MFRAALLVALACLALGSPINDLKISLLTSGTAEDIVISVVVHNPTDADIRVSNTNNILDTFGTESFDVSKDGKPIQFTGLRVYYDSKAEAGYTTIPAGSSVAVNHTEVTSLYDFASAGTGKFSFAPKAIFKASYDLPRVVVSASAVTVEVTKTIGRRENFPRKTVPTCDNADQKQYITDALNGALQMARNAAEDIKNWPDSPDFKRYFGNNDPKEVSSLFKTIAKDSAFRKFSCVDEARKACEEIPAMIAYTWYMGPGQENDLFTCPMFFTTPRQSCEKGLYMFHIDDPSLIDFLLVEYDAPSDSVEGVVLHEISHSDSGTHDYIEGCANTIGLPDDQKLMNADNYRCYGLAVFHRNCKLVT